MPSLSKGFKELKISVNLPILKENTETIPFIFKNGTRKFFLQDLISISFKILFVFAFMMFIL
ncbi:MAG: hypothetical protein LBU14_04765 [Candidatus Peribacteria bacterium]|nr:hypothetical protein [Candidatus Peribacteria bacterium]